MQPQLFICIPTLFFSLVLIGCGFDVEDPTPPSRPMWVEKSLLEEWPERGIDAHETGGIFLEWEPAIGEDIIAYNIYRADLHNINDSLGNYDLIFHLETETVRGLEYLDMNIESGIRYFYKVNSEDSANNLSDFSDSLSYLVLPPISVGTMSPNGIIITLGEDRRLSWQYGYEITMNNYCLTLLTQGNQLLIREVIYPQNYLDWGDSWKIPESIVLDSGAIYKWRFDTNGVLSGGRENSSSESPWATFLYNK